MIWHFLTQIFGNGLLNFLATIWALVGHLWDLFGGSGGDVARSAATLQAPIIFDVRCSSPVGSLRLLVLAGSATLG